jgi:Uma2 family endonuclease
MPSTIAEQIERIDQAEEVARTGRKRFVPGTMGWTEDDLDDPEIERQWLAGRFEIVEGVLAAMPPAYFDGTTALGRLIRAVTRYLDQRGQSGDFGPETDVVAGKNRVARVDAVFLTDADLRQQQAAQQQRRKGRTLKYGRIRIPPTLVIESLSRGHEEHDRVTKLRWFAEFGVRNYWILDPYAKSLECLVLDGASYRVDQQGRGSDELRPSLFCGLVIPLKDQWG